jgi:hypothetical protein
VDNDLERIWKEAVVTYALYYPNICGTSQKSSVRIAGGWLRFEPSISEII